MRTGLNLTETSPDMKDWGLTVLRIVVGVVFLMHGWQKLFDLGIPGVAGFFGDLGVPAPLLAATGVSVLEAVGGAALIAGLLTRPLAALLVMNMLGAALLVHAPNGFFLPNGVEFVLLLGASSAALAISGPGVFAIDRVLTGQSRRLRVLRPTSPESPA